MNETRVKPIKLKDNDTDKEYILEFNKRTVAKTYDLGFRRDEFFNNIEKHLPLLWYGAFLMHHGAEVSKKKAEDLLHGTGGLTEAVVERLIDLFNEPSKGLVVTEEEAEENAKNATATVEL